MTKNLRIKQLEIAKIIAKHEELGKRKGSENACLEVTNTKIIFIFSIDLHHPNLKSDIS